MYLYKSYAIVSDSISKQGFYEYKATQSILSALLYYSIKQNEIKNNFFILDV